MAYLAVVAATEGRRRGFSAVVGVALGLSIVGLLAAFGLTALVAGSAMAYQGLRWLGVGYLLWLAYDGWRGADGVASLAAVSSSNWRYFKRGLITNLLNPKAAAFYMAVLPTFLGATESPRETLMFTAVYVVVATGIHAGIVAMAGAARAIFENPTSERILRRVLSIGLAAIAVWFAVKTAQ